MSTPIVAACLIALASLSGALLLGNHPLIAAARRFMVPVAVGVFLSAVFFELLPEAFHETEYASVALAFGFLGFYLLAHLISQYHHHHGDECNDHHAKGEGFLILIGDSVHNFVDGIVIAVAFSFDPTAGIAVALGILFHEVPQEIAQFSVLLRAGLSRGKALLYNFISATTVILGTALTLFFIETFEALVGILIAVAAGNLLYIAASDLLPELVGDRRDKTHFWRQFALVTLGLAVMAILFAATGEAH